ncbi:SLC47A1 [Symbiodinium pilosum]|uniref:SLC47A1 protein n=1 Tax=Symbiodinium pilosum TaxID=2952 RepID=A0A812R468_SYMPI|nr:SLC47A1 [Symbiodinium pilosum]
MAAARDLPEHGDRDLLRRLVIVAAPSWPIQAVARLVGLVEAAVIGQHLDEAALAAIGLGNVITNITGFSSLWGLSAGISTLSSQDWGASNFKALGITLQRAFLILLCVVDLPLLLIWLNSAKLLVAAGQHPDVAHYVGLYSSVRAPGLLFMSANCVLSRTLSAISNVQINLWMSITAALLHVCLSFLFIPSLGFVGAPVAACICDAYESLGILVLASRNPDFRKCWGGFTREAFSQWGSYLRISCPALMLMCIEWWTWDLMSFLAGFVSELAQAVQSVAPAVGDLQYSLGQAMGNGASTVVGNMLGEGNHKAAKRAARLTITLAVAAGQFQIGRTDVP